jgi:hypothetical protein
MSTATVYSEWAREKVRIMKLSGRLFRGGPMLLTLIMIAASIAYIPWRHHNSWMAFAIMIGAPTNLVWHILLVALERPKIQYVLYALANLFAYVSLGIFGLFLVTGEAP